VIALSCMSCLVKRSQDCVKTVTAALTSKFLRFHPSSTSVTHRTTSVSRPYLPMSKPRHHRFALPTYILSQPMMSCHPYFFSRIFLHHSSFCPPASRHECVTRIQQLHKRAPLAAPWLQAQHAPGPIWDAWDAVDGYCTVMRIKSLYVRMGKWDSADLTLFLFSMRTVSIGR
jgi:hypothetical protein